MFEPYLRQPGLRLPMVMSIVTRDTLTPQSVWGGHQDAMSVREVGWIQMYCETVQEVLDTVVMGFRIAEHRDVMLPVNVCHDGNYLSFGATRVDLPAQNEVDAFLGRPNINWHAALDPLRPMGVDPLTGGAGGAGPKSFVRYRKGLCAGMQNALSVIAEAHADWARHTGRQHAPLVERYRMDGAQTAVVTIGSMTGAAKDAIDEARDRGAGRAREGEDVPPVPDRRHCRVAGRRGCGGRGSLGVLRLELRPSLPGRRRGAGPRGQTDTVDELHRRARGRRPDDGPFRRGDRARRAPRRRRSRRADRVAQRE
jgi:hypothetical protein